MYLLKFEHENKNYFLHGGEGWGFTGAMSEEKAHIVSASNIGKSIGFKGGFTVTHVSDEMVLADMLGITPKENYSIINFFSGLGIPFYAVEIVR